MVVADEDRIFLSEPKMYLAARILLTIGFALPLFSNSDSFALPSQFGALVAIGMCAAICFSQPRRTVSTIDFGGKMLIAAAILSLLASATSGFFYGVLYSFLFLYAVVCAEIIRSRFHSSAIQVCFCHALIGMIAIVVLSYPDDFLASIKGTTIRGVGLVRFSPFDLHPNLAGFIFAAGAIALAFRTMKTPTLIGKAMYAGATMGALAVVFSASARASLVACALAGVAYAPVFLVKNRQRLITLLPLLAVGFVVVALIVALNFTSIADYFTVIFDLDSDTRGIDSGGSGRSELWQAGIDLFWSQGIQLVIGNGLRYASPETIGFSTESSFITILLENGLIGAAAIFGTIALAIIYQFKKALRVRGVFTTEEALFALLVYAVVQSIFNRYLLAVGNSFSLYLIFAFVSPFKWSWEELSAAYPRFSLSAATATVRDRTRKPRRDEETDEVQNSPENSLPPIKW